MSTVEGATGVPQSVVGSAAVDTGAVGTAVNKLETMARDSVRTVNAASRVLSLKHHLRR